MSRSTKAAAADVPDKVPTMDGKLWTEIKGYPFVDTVSDPGPIIFDDPEVTALVAHLMASGVEPGCVFAKLTAPGPVKDWNGREGVHGPGPGGPVRSILPDGNGGYKVTTPDGKRALQTTADLPEGETFPDDDVRREIQLHFRNLTEKGKERYLNRLVALGHSPAAFGLATAEA